MPIATNLTADTVLQRFDAVRSRTADLARRLDPEDCVVQTMADVSPTKWHLAHTTWFFETFVLVPNVPDYVLFDQGFGYLFNSYYESVGPRQPRPRRGMLTRPTLREVFQYREAVETGVRALLSGSELGDHVYGMIEVGMNHEQQHQELLVADIKHVLGTQPLEPDMPGGVEFEPPITRVKQAWLRVEAGMREVGHDGEGFAFDNEAPRHPVYIGEFEIASRPVSNGEFAGFIADGGYERHELWLSDGWQDRRDAGITAPLYWRRESDGWSRFGLAGRERLQPDEPVAHISFYEADAYARWRGARLPTEFEWEVAWGDREDFRRSVGSVWEWTGSAYAPYPGFRVRSDALAEYNGKFMCNQMVLRGGSKATPAGHSRPTYRNFFYPAQRWQFSGLRLAR